MSNPTVNEGDAANFTVTLSEPQPSQIGVSFTMIGAALGTATPGVDFVGSTSGLLFFPAGSTTQTIPIQTIGDALSDSGETINLRLTEVLGGAIGTTLPVQGTMTIVDVPNPKPAVRTANVTVNEGDVGLTPVAFTVNLSVPSTNPITISYATAGGSAISDVDFKSTNGSITFAPGETSQTVVLNVIGDTNYEFDESFNLVLTGGTDVAIIETRPVATIVNDDPIPTLSIDDVSVVEGDTGSKTATFTLTQSAPMPSSFQYDISVVNGSAVYLSDYLATNTRITFATGETVKTFTVTILGDTFTEGDETFLVNVTKTQSGANIIKGTGVGTIVNDDPVTGTLRLPAGAWGIVQDSGANGSFESATPGGGPNFLQLIPNFVENRVIQEFDVSRVVSGDVQYVRFDYSSLDSASSGPFTASFYAYSGNGTIETSDANGGVLVGTGQVNTATPPRMSVSLDRATILGLAASSNWVGIRIQLNGPSGTGAILTPLGRFTTVFNPPDPTAPALVFGTTAPAVPTISVGAVNVSESGSRLNFPLTLSEPTVVPVTVQVSTAPGTATAGFDYSSLNTTVTFQPGSTTATASVVVISDTIYESNETVLLNLSNPINGVIGSTPGIGTIVDDDVPPQMRIANAVVTEGNSGTTDAVFTVTVVGATAVPITFDFATADDTAISGSDYVARTGTVTIAPGVTTATFAVPVIGDTLPELQERFYVNVTNVQGATLVSSQVSGFINNDDPLPQATAGAGSVVEGNAGNADLVFTVSLLAFGGGLQASTTPVTVFFLLQDGTATSGVDYVNNFATTPGTVTFAPGETVKQVHVPVIGDLHLELNETLTLRINAVTGAANIGPNSTAVGQILNDDFPTVQASSTTANEGSPVTYTAIVNDPNPVSGNVTYRWSVDNGITVFNPSVTGPTFIYTPPDNGTYSISVAANDIWTVQSQPTVLTVTNVAPTPTIIGIPSTVNERDTVNLSDSITDPGSVDLASGFSRSWTLTKNGVAYASSNTPYLSFTPDDNGIYVVSLTVTDKDGGIGTTSSTITVNNLPPVASILSFPSTGLEGSTIHITGTAGDLGPLDTLSLAWNVSKNGVAYTTGIGGVLDFIPNDNGTYVATLIATDKDGGVGSASCTITVSNVAPTPTINAPATVTEGTMVNLTASSTDPGTLDSVTYIWQLLKDGGNIATGGGSTFNFTAIDNGTYVAKLTAVDNDGDVGTTTATVLVTNVAPTAKITGAPSTVAEGTAVTLTGSAIDPGVLDTFAYSWLVTKNGFEFATFSGTSTITFTPNDNAIYVAKLTVFDNDAASGTTTATILATNVAPTPTLNGAPATTTEGSAVLLTATATDPGSLDTITYTWSVTKNGAAFVTGSGANFNFTPNDNGTYVATLTATDKDSDSRSTTSSIMVTNVAPTAVANFPSTVVRGQATTFNFSATDASSVDQGSTFTYVIQWGDGTTQTITGPGPGIAISRVYPTNGSYAIKITAKDKDGATSATRTQNLTVVSALLQDGTLTVGGTSANDLISLQPIDTAGSIRVTINGSVAGTFTAPTRIVADGYAGDDVIELLNNRIRGTVYTISARAVLFGSAGNDLLDGSEATGSLVLVGGTGNDELRGGSGRDLLIGGTGSDVLYGGDGDDILIGGSTAFDTNLSLLGVLVDEWVRTDVTYTNRVNRLNGTATGGLNGTTYLNSLTVFNDSGSTDDLWGEAGSDWFIISVPDRVRDRVNGERLTTI